jgi:hypothetical protein
MAGLGRASLIVMMRYGTVPWENDPVPDRGRVASLDTVIGVPACTVE